jgi:hypothetical protein
MTLSTVISVEWCVWYPDTSSDQDSAWQHIFQIALVRW